MLQYIFKSTVSHPGKCNLQLLLSFILPPTQTGRATGLSVSFCLLSVCKHFVRLFGLLFHFFLVKWQIYSSQKGRPTAEIQDRKNTQDFFSYMDTQKNSLFLFYPSTTSGRGIVLPDNFFFRFLFMIICICILRREFFFFFTPPRQVEGVCFLFSFPFVRLCVCLSVQVCTR